MPSIDEMQRGRANTRIDVNGILHAISVMDWVRDDESKYWDARCMCKDWHSLPVDTHEEAVAAGKAHLESVRTATTAPTVTSIMRRKLPFLSR